MSSDTSKTSKLLQVFEALTEMGFQGHSMEEIAIETGFSYAAVRRSLITLENHGWVIDSSIPGSKQKRWSPSKKIIQIAFQYKRHCLNQRQKLESEYVRVTGEVMRDESR